MWLAPHQVNIIPVNNNYHLEYAKEVEKLLKNKGIRVNLDDREEKVGYKMREAIMSKYPYILVLGDNEVTNKTITYRTSQSEEKVTITLDEFANKVEEEIKNKTR